LDTFFAVRGTNRCTLTGWDHTICGTYSDIADAVNARHGTSYTNAEIGWALTWLHQWGPDMSGAYVSKIGPGNHKTTVVFDDVTKSDIIVDGGVYLLVVDGVPMPHEKRRILAAGLIEWCDYRFNGLRNDVIDLSMTRGAFPASDPANRSIRRSLQTSIDRSKDEMVEVQKLQRELTRLI
jgi:hypothetical protein